MDVENMAKKADPRSLTYMNNFMARQGNGDFDMALMEPATSGTDEKHEVGLFLRICRCFTKENDSLKVTEVNGANVGVAFFLDFPFHALKTDHKEGEDTIIRLVHYSDNYFSLELPWNGIINICSKCGDLEDPIKVFSWMSQRNSVSWNSLIASFVLVGWLQGTTNV
nr:mannosylglycoprotein endo-beta-mannosidase [Quercus suber]